MGNRRCQFAGLLGVKDGSDGTRTRDLRRDRPVRRNPATAGYDPELLATAGISSPGEPAVTGYDRLPPGTACVAGVWSAWCLLRQRRHFRGTLRLAGVGTSRSPTRKRRPVGGASAGAAAPPSWIVTA